MALNLPFQPPIEPMLAKAVDSLPKDDGWLFEPKWDGFRALVFRDGDEVYTQSRDLKPLDRYFPELADPLRAALPDRCILDGEIVIAQDGALAFESLLLRIHPAASRVRMLAAESPASFVAWDLLALDDEDLRGIAQADRRLRLEGVLGGAQPPVHLTPVTRDRATAADWFARFEGAGLDGVIAKRLDATYQPGKRAMLKIKHQRTADCVVAGFRWHKNGPGTHVGSLLLGLYDDEGTLHHVGVTSSFSWDRRAELVGELAGLRDNAMDGHPWSGWADWAAEMEASGQRVPGATSRWNRGKDLSWEALRPERVAEVAYDHLQGDRFRHGTTFKRWRPDKPPDACRYDQLEETAPFELSEIFSGGRVRHRLGLIGAGWISGLHLEALARLDRTELVGVVSGTGAGAATIVDQWGGRVFERAEAMLDDARPDVVYVCVPPFEAVALGELLVDRGIPFLTEKPLAADDADGPERLAAAIERAGLVVGVGYHLRALDVLPEVRARLTGRHPGLIVAQWLGDTPGPAWWGLAAQGGGQVIEQATHLYDLARLLLGEAVVVAAASNRDPAGSQPAVDVADATAAVLRFDSGAIGSFTNSRRIASGVVSVQIASNGLLTTLAKGSLSQGDWHVRFETEEGATEHHAKRDPYEVQAAAFLDAVEAGDPARPLSTYADALRTDRLTRAVVAATGAAG